MVESRAMTNLTDLIKSAGCIARQAAGVQALTSQVLGSRFCKNGGCPIVASSMVESFLLVTTCMPADVAVKQQVSESLWLQRMLYISIWY